MVKGDIPSPELVEDAKAVGLGHLFPEAEPAVPESMPGIAAMPVGQDQAGVQATRVGAMVSPNQRGGIRFAGSPAQRKEAQEKQQALAAIAAMPDGPQKTALQNAAAMGVAPNAAMLQPPQEADFTLSPGQTRFGPDGKRIASIAPAQSGGVGGGANAKTQRMVDALLARPSAWRELTPTAKTEALPELVAAGFDFDAAESGLTPSMRAGVSRLTSSLSMLQELDGALTQQRGITGRAAGKVQQWYARASGEDSEAGLYDAISEALLPALARSSGEVGNLAEKEQVRYARLAPKVSDPVNIRQAKYAAMQFLIDAAEAGKKADELEPFLNYMQFSGTPPTTEGATGGSEKKLTPADIRAKYGKKAAQ
jgi:hypothetical protein